MDLDSSSDFILQDELHLIDSPARIDRWPVRALKELTSINGDRGAKYIASTATARRLTRKSLPCMDSGSRSSHLRH